MINFGSKIEVSWLVGGLARCVPVIFWDFETTKTHLEANLDQLEPT